MQRNVRIPSAFVPTCLAALLVIAPGLSLAAEPNSLTPEEIAEGWILLFDGESLFGWKKAGNADWKVADGAITASEGDAGLLVTTSQFGNYALKVDFRAATEANSGVFLRTSPNPGPDDVATRCYEVNIADAGQNDFPTGSLVQRKKAEPVEPSGDWRTFEITADGGRFTVKLDGKEVCDYTDPNPLGRGFIGLQFRSGKVEFRNVKLQPLATKSLFNGKDLAGWKTYPDMASVFSVTPAGELNVKNGRGQLETEGQFEDFTLQLDVFVNGKGLNSGVFFRSIPGETMNGYECQIQNAYENDDPKGPNACVTGGFFRRQDARKIVAKDFEWFTLTLHADDNHMAAWVNGYPVSDWTDRREPNPNPRKGLRLEAGTIQLQGHDPTTDFSFRNLRIAELPPR
ncbi:MAG: DUF1080 domain-containing protein [Rhodopirellula sp.]|nr:DUF1080 domain-containing protein [Rhodopirellula sp.]